MRNRLTSALFITPNNISLDSDVLPGQTASTKLLWEPIDNGLPTSQPEQQPDHQEVDEVSPQQPGNQERTIDVVPPQAIDKEMATSQPQTQPYLQEVQGVPAPQPGNEETGDEEVGSKGDDSEAEGTEEGGKEVRYEGGEQDANGKEDSNEELSYGGGDPVVNPLEQFIYGVDYPGVNAFPNRPSRVRVNSSPTKKGQTAAAKRKNQLQDDKECGDEYERIVTTDGCLHDTIVACFCCGVDSKVACLIQGLHRKRGWWSKNSLSEAPAWPTLLGVAVSPTLGSQG